MRPAPEHRPSPRSSAALLTAALILALAPALPAAEGDRVVLGLGFGYSFPKGDLQNLVGKNPGNFISLGNLVNRQWGFKAEATAAMALGPASTLRASLAYESFDKVQEDSFTMMPVGAGTQITNTVESTQVDALTAAVDFLYRPRGLGGLYAGAGLGFKQWFWTLRYSAGTTNLYGQPVFNATPQVNQDVTTSGPRARAILGFAPVPRANVELVLESGQAPVPNARTLARSNRTLTTLAITFGLHFPSPTRGR